MSSDEETEELPKWKGIPATIICINVYDPQHHNTAEVAYTATCRMIRQYLRISSSHLIGVCLFGTEGSNSSIFGIKSVEEVFPLNLPSMQDFEKLQKLNLSSVKQAQELVMSDVLWYCSKAFASCKRQLSTRNVIILSRFDIPPIQTDQKPALKRVVDLTDANIDIMLLNISKVEYSIDQFYKDFLINANQSDDCLPQPLWDHKEVERLMNQESHRHLAVARLSFEIGDGLAIGVGIYSLLKGYGQSRMKKSNLHRDTNAILTTVNKTMKVNINNDVDMDVDEEESRPVPLLNSEKLHYQTIGDERIEFTDDEMKTLRNPFGSPMLKLLGFKPSTIICKEKWYFKASNFLFPNEAIVEGSIVAFKALHQACLETNMVAICVLSTRVNTKTVIVALHPTTKPLSLDVDIGFDVIKLPFVENVRDLPIPEDEIDINIPSANKTIMKEILNTLEFDYKPEMFENPQLQAQYRAVEAIALEGLEIDPFIDTTKPDQKRFEDVKDDVFQELFGPFNVSTVRKLAPSGTGGPTAKKARTEGVDDSLLEQRITNRKVADYTVAQLKEILRCKEIPNLPALTGMKKNELVNLVYQYCN